MGGMRLIALRIKYAVSIAMVCGYQQLSLVVLADNADDIQLSHLRIGQNNDIDINPLYLENGSFYFDISSEETNVIIANSSSEVTVNTPTIFGLSAAYPNPFNPSTSISLHLSMESDVSVQVYDLSGRMISTLLSGVQAQGDYNLTWNAQEQASGMYLVRAETAGSVAVQKILLLK